MNDDKPKQFESEPQKADRLAKQLLKLLGGATGYDEIKAALPKLQPFFNKLSAEDFALLLDEGEKGQRRGENPIHTALWYHYGNLIEFATKRCALATPERMKMLYPMWREWTEEAKGYSGSEYRQSRSWKPLDIEVIASERLPKEEAEIKKLAVWLSELLKSEYIPQEIKDGIHNAVDKVVFAAGLELDDKTCDSPYLTQIMQSREYIETALRLYYLDEPNEKTVLDLSNHAENLDITAETMTNLLNKDLPADVQQVLHSWCAEHPEKH